MATNKMMKKQPFYHKGNGITYLLCNQPEINCPQREQLMALDQDTGFMDSMIEERDQDITNIAASIEEINGIFVDLAQLVNEQSPMIGMRAR